MLPLAPSAPSTATPRFLLYPREGCFFLQRERHKAEVKFSTIQGAITHLHGSPENVGASLVVFNEDGKPIMQIQISHFSLSAAEQKPNLSLDYDTDQKSFMFRRAGEDGSESFPSMKAAIAHLSRYIKAESQLTVRDALGKPMFFATIGPEGGAATEEGL